MKIIDAHVGFGPWGWRNPVLPGTTAEITAILDYCGVDEAIVCCNVMYVNGLDANTCVLREINGNPRFSPAFLLTPQTYDTHPSPKDYAESMRQAGAKVAWLRPAMQSHTTASWLIGDLLAMCVAHRLPLFVPMDGGVSYDDVHRICREYPGLRLVLANIGYRSDTALFPLLRLHRELHICLGQTYCTALAPERFARHFGPERMIFGSGLPQCAPGGLIAMVAYSQLSDDAKQLIFAGNIQRLMSEVRL
jgi:predicted TIM-barrel fold metal-dependent hydrolase